MGLFCLKLSCMCCTNPDNQFNVDATLYELFLLTWFVNVTF